MTIVVETADSSPPASTTSAPLWIAAIAIGLMAWGWIQRDEYWINAESGLGYLFGIAGATMMLLLLLYPLSKKARFMRSIIATRYWFKGHMLLGIAGPLLILFHCNFSTGSTNSNVALFSMLLVVASGLVGRYLYRRTHNGLYGKKLNYDDLQKQHLHHKGQFLKRTDIDAELSSLLQEIETISDGQNHSLVHSWRGVISARRKTKQLSQRLKVLARQTPDNDPLIAGLQLNVAAEQQLLRSMVGLSFYNRLFSIWHVVHLPFFYMLIITAIVHVVVVHMY